MVAIRTLFDRQLQDLDNSTLRLAELVETQLTQAVRALQTRDLATARRVDEFDATINQLRYEIEEHCYELLALQQPNARDMRRIVAGVSIATNLERMGDHAAGIARVTQRIADMPVPVHVPLFTDMAKLASANLMEALKAMAAQDAILARAVVRRDDEVDKMHKLVYGQLIQTMMTNPATVEYATLLLWVSHDIERFADRISNICERIIYTVTGNLYELRNNANQP